MVRLVRRHVGRERGDEGIALVVAIALILVVGMVIATVATIAIYESRATGRDRSRSEAVAAAELALDTYMAQIDGDYVATVPCGTSTSTVQVGPDTVEIETTVTYLKENGSLADPSTHVSCTDLALGTPAAQAHVIATAEPGTQASQQPVARTVETLLDLTPVYANSMNKAIFGRAGITFANHVSLYGENGTPNADLYTDGNIACQNNQEFQGTIYAQGQVTMANSCRVAVDVHAGTLFRADNPSVTINGRVLVANGNATVNAKFSLGQQMLVSGTIDGGSKSQVCTPGKCFEHATVPPVPQEDFPKMLWSGYTDFVSRGGYSNVQRFGPGGMSCTGSIPNQHNGKADWVGYQIWKNFAEGTWNADTVVLVDCPQKVMYQGLDLTLPHNLVVYSKNGFVFSNKTIVASNDPSQNRALYLIQPYDALTCSTWTEGISLDNQVTVRDEVDVLMYSPCNVRKANNTTYYGQIYAGGYAQIDNKLEMFYKPLPVFGVSDSTTVEAYTTDILYKRETF